MQMFSECVLGETLTHLYYISSQKYDYCNKMGLLVHFLLELKKHRIWLTITGRGLPLYNKPLGLNNYLYGVYLSLLTNSLLYNSIEDYLSHFLCSIHIVQLNSQGKCLAASL